MVPLPLCQQKGRRNDCRHHLRNGDRPPDAVDIQYQRQHNHRRCLEHKNTQKGDERRNAAIAQRRKKTGAKDIKARQQKGKREQPERVLCQRKQTIIKAHKDVSKGARRCDCQRRQRHTYR